MQTVREECTGQDRHGPGTAVPQSFHVRASDVQRNTVLAVCIPCTPPLPLVANHSHQLALLMCSSPHMWHPSPDCPSISSLYLPPGLTCTSVT